MNHDTKSVKQLELQEAVDGITEWLNVPQEHLNSMTRKRALEIMLIGFAETVRVREIRKAWVQSATLWGSLIALFATLGPTVLEILQVVIGAFL